jgi:O-antigen/teichoic acid export membrane protein
MINLTFQALAVGLRSILVFVFIFLISKEMSPSAVSIILSEFTYASIFSFIICFGFDYSLVQEGNEKIFFKSFILKLFLGTIIVCLLCYAQNLSIKLLFYSFALACASMFKGFVRLKQNHKTDFLVNLFTFIFFLFFVFTLQIEPHEYLWYLSVSLLLPNLSVLCNVIKFHNNNNLQDAFKSLYKSAPLAIFSVVSYLWLNVDVYIFDYLDRISSYQYFTIPNKFFINLTMVPVIYMNYRIAYIFKNDRKLVKVFYDFFIIGIVLSLFAFLISNPIIKIITDGNVILIPFISFLFSLIVFLRCINTYFSMIILKKVSNWIRLYIILFTVIVHVVLLTLFIAKFDWIGAIYSLLITTILFTVINFLVTKEYFINVK